MSESTYYECCNNFGTHTAKCVQDALKENYKKIMTDKMRIPTFLEGLDKMKELHIKKNEDYASSDNPFSNFDATEDGISLFRNDRDKVFACQIYNKLSRLANLLNNSNQIPNNESIEDTYIDVANYMLLWRSDYLNRQKNRTEINKTSILLKCDYCRKEISNTDMTILNLPNYEQKYFCTLFHAQMYLGDVERSEINSPPIPNFGNIPYDQTKHFPQAQCPATMTKPHRRCRLIAGHTSDHQFNSTESTARNSKCL